MQNKGTKKHVKNRPRKVRQPGADFDVMLVVFRDGIPVLCRQLPLVRGWLLMSRFYLAFG